jgi:hypothetical protein
MLVQIEEVKNKYLFKNFLMVFLMYLKKYKLIDLT